MTNQPSPPYNPSDPYESKLDNLRHHVGSLYDANNDLKAIVIQQREELSELRSILIAALELIDS